jgi:predicted N-formylglutamate amidohydrolase
MVKTFLLTCEHAGNDLPAEYARLFQGKEEVLWSHKAMDFGALALAEHLAAATALPLYATATCRLLVEANRSLENEALFSAYSRQLPEQDKKVILDKYYFPHRNLVEEKIHQEVAAGHQVIHLAVHTFTPVLAGEVREADIGILFDPGRPPEEAFARHLKEKLLHQHAGRNVRYNAPYPGTADGLPTYLRQKFSPQQYAGFELEVNQKFFLHGDPRVWQKVVAEITAAWQAATGADKGRP